MPTNLKLLRKEVAGVNLTHTKHNAAVMKAIHLCHFGLKVWQI